MPDTRACNPLNTCCYPPARPEVTSASSPIDQYVSVVNNPTLRGYSRQTLHNVVETGNAFRQLTNQCRTGSHRILGRGPIADLLTLPCMAGGVIQGMATAVLSFGERLGDTLYSLVHGRPETKGMAAADILFLGLEVAGYGQMTAGAMRPRPALSLPREVPPAPTNFSWGGASTAAAVPYPVMVSAPSLPLPTVTGMGLAGIASAAPTHDGSNFGGPTATPKPLRATMGGSGEELPGADPKAVRKAEKLRRAEILEAGTSGAGIIDELLKGMFNMIRQKPPSWLAEHRPRLIALRDELRRIQSLYRNQKQSEAQARFANLVRKDPKSLQYLSPVDLSVRWPSRKKFGATNTSHLRPEEMPDEIRDRMIMRGALSGKRVAADRYLSRRKKPK